MLNSVCSCSFAWKKKWPEVQSTPHDEQQLKAWQVDQGMRRNAIGKLVTRRSGEEAC